MTNLTSFDRDMTWLNGNITALAWPAVGSLATPLVAAGAATQPKFGFAKANSSTTVAAGFTRSIGVIMPGPVEESLTFRVKGSAFSQDGETKFAFGYGYPPSPLGASPFSVANPVYIWRGQNCDELVCVRPQLSGDSYEGRDLVFFVAALEGPSAVSCVAYISVQNTGVSPDAYSVAVR